MNNDDQQIINEIETKFPEMTQEFKKIQEEQYILFCRKQLNYGPSNISLGTTCQTDDDIKLSLSGLWFRMNDKINRLKQLIILSKKDCVNESVDETFIDLGNYSIISMIVNKKKWGK